MFFLGGGRHEDAVAHQLYNGQRIIKKVLLITQYLGKNCKTDSYLRFYKDLECDPIKVTGLSYHCFSSEESGGKFSSDVFTEVTYKSKIAFVGRGSNAIAYIPGSWEDDLEVLYQSALKREAAAKKAIGALEQTVQEERRKWGL